MLTFKVFNKKGRKIDQVMAEDIDVAVERMLPGLDYGVKIRKNKEPVVIAGFWEGEHLTVCREGWEKSAGAKT